MTTWVKIENFQCPGKDCCNDKKIKQWSCSADNTPVYMSQTGYIRCSSVVKYMTFNDANKYAHYDQICNWRWDCGEHHSFMRFMEADKESFLLSMSMALQMVKAKGKAKWIAALVLELGNQFGEEDDSDEDQDSDLR
ncbi:uncharacterized protein LOC143055375 [Mytilus galloprovincialis]|uniref:uncharacterized protein LOC143055375 n=1 Tax=Mytilus galloprovincialis TaxID=29158 RepID=UPI003F7BDD15